MNQSEQLLTILNEECVEVIKECAEVIQRVTKALRFGLDEIQPEQCLTNAERIVAEVNDLLAVAEMIGLQGIGNRAAIERKKVKVQEFLAYSVQCGTFNS